MESCALCVINFPLSLIEKITSIDSTREIDNDFLLKAIIIKSELGIRTEIINPLDLLNPLIYLSGSIPE